MQMTLIYVYKEGNSLRFSQCLHIVIPVTKVLVVLATFSILFSLIPPAGSLQSTTSPLGRLSLMIRAWLPLLRMNIGLGIRVLFKLKSAMSFFRLLTPMQVWALITKSSKETVCLSGELCRLLDCPPHLVTVLVGILSNFLFVRQAYWVYRLASDKTEQRRKIQ